MVVSADKRRLRLSPEQPDQNSHLAKTHLQHVLTAAAMNLMRLGAWFAGTPLARTRQSAFTKLMMGSIPA
ncbi:hypothetical protein DC522_30760 [Microvirga sp. KLBC 81]|nr:hypothetical protein DC522_30760 [Microvirga sp. KLBC 81]